MRKMILAAAALMTLGLGSAARADGYHGYNNHHGPYRHHSGYPTHRPSYGYGYGYGGFGTFGPTIPVVRPRVYPNPYLGYGLNPFGYGFGGNGCHTYGRPW